MRDANGNYTLYAYDSLNRMTSVTQMLDTHEVITQFFYDSDDNLTKVVDPDSNIFTYLYDDKGRLAEDSSTITGLTTYGYNAANNLIYKKDAKGDSTAYSYDALNRLIAVTFADTSQYIYFYDDTTTGNYCMGRLYRAETPACTTTYKYNAHGRIVEEKRMIDSNWYTTWFGYNRNGYLSGMTYPTGLQVIYLPDTTGRPEKVDWKKSSTSWQTAMDNIEYLPFGPQTSCRYGNGVQTDVIYNQRYLVDSITTGEDHIMQLKYIYDSVGNIVEIRDGLDSDNKQIFEYDDLNRLISAISASYPSDSLRYTYFDNGNRSTKKEGTNTTTYHYTYNKLDSLFESDTIIIVYDDLGNTISIDTGVELTYEYDYAGHMVSVDTGITAAYEYDDQSKRIRKVDSRMYIYDQEGQVIAEYFDQSEYWRAHYIYLNGKPIAKVTPPDSYPPNKADKEYIYYYHTDHLGTPHMLTDKNRNAKWSAEYLPFGEIYNESFAVRNNLRFPGQYHDTETDLYYNWHRYYNPDIGRYMQADPIGLLSTDMNWYRYVFNNPIIATDPFGLKIKWGDYVVTNTHVRFNLERLNQAIIDQGFSDNDFTIRVTGGDRYIGPDGTHISATTNQPITHSSKTSPHLIERGARAVDFQLEGIGKLNQKYDPCMMKVFDKALRKTDFLPANTIPQKTDKGYIKLYYDGHIHVALPFSPQYMWHPPMQWPVDTSK